MLILQAFEWELITSLISFQKNLDADQIGVRREFYISEEERKVVRRYWACTLYNIIFHSVKICLWYLTRYSIITMTQWWESMTFWNTIFVTSLAFLIILTGSRLIAVASSFSIHSYASHRVQILLMVTTIAICEPSQFYSVFLHETTIFANQ